MILLQKLKFVSEKLKQPDFQKKLINYISTFWGPGYSIEIKTQSEGQDGATLKQAEATEQNEKVSKERQMVENHPLVKKASSTFKTKITKMAIPIVKSVSSLISVSSCKNSNLSSFIF